MRVWLAHPRWRLSCSTCLAYGFTQEGSLVRDENGFPSPRGGVPTPCLYCPKVPDWAKQSCDVEFARSHADELSPLHRKALAFYFRCKGSLRFPADPLVSYYAGVIRECEDECEAARAAEASRTVDRLCELVLVSLSFRR